MKKFSAFLIAIVLAFSTTAIPIDFGAETAQAHADVCTAITYSIGGGDEKTFSIKGDNAKSLAVGKTLKLKVTDSPGGIVWSSSNKKVATVSKKGKVKAKKPGKTTIVATSTTTDLAVQCTVTVYKKCTQSQARKRILSLKKKYYEGREWTNNDGYFWEAANTECYGCIAFAGIASDKAFSKYAPVKYHSKFNKIKVGDHIRIGDWHSVVVLYKKKNSVIVAEGNFNESIHWGREITKSELKAEGFSVWTRY